MTISDISIEHYLILSSLLFAIGMSGLFLNRRNIINMLMSIEIMFLAVNINFVTFSVQLENIVGQIFSLIVLAIAAAEISIGLAILVLYYRKQNTIAVEDMKQMQG